MRQASKPRKSSSILILRRKLNSYFDYDILFLKRNSKMSFGDTWAFPGGTLDPSDQTYAKTYFPEDSVNAALKICALRETFEETGLFLGNLKDRKEKEGLNSLSSTKDFIQLQEAHSPGMASLKNFLRLITIQILPKRFDTYFYIYDVNEQNCYNVELFKKNKDACSLKNFNELLINKEESSDCKWMDPLEILKKYFEEKNIQLAPPQLFLLNILTSLPRITDIYNLLNKFSQPESKGISSKLAHPDPLTFPFIIQPVFGKSSNKYEVSYLFPGDFEFPVEEISNNEADEEFGDYLRKSHNSVKSTNKTFRITNIYEGEGRMRRLKEFLYVQNNLEWPTPFQLLRTNQQIFTTKSKL